jgi:UDP-glucose 4-epimerase
MEASVIGLHVARHCMHMGHEAGVLDHLSGYFEDRLLKGVQFVDRSVTNEELVTELFEPRLPEYVVSA